LALCAGPRLARAQPSGADVSASLSTDEAEVGEPFTVELRAMVEGDSLPSDAQLYVPSGIDVSGPSVSTRVMSRFGSGGTYVKRGIGATWQLVAQRPGSYVIPAPTVMVGGERITAGRSMRVHVVPATGRPRSRPSTSPFGFPSPFGMPGGSSPFPFGIDSMLDNEPADEPRTTMGEEAQKLAMPIEPEPYVFVRAIADKTEAVVGEQVTLSFYVYYRADFEMTDRREPSLSDFIRVSMMQSPGADAPITTQVGNWRYLVRLLDRVALFPLRAGKLHTGSLGALFTGARVGHRVERSSNDLVVDVREPPRKGRPPGYRLGDVGSYRISAEVAPREIAADGTVAVQLRLQGIGNVPQSIDVPERAGIEWIDPERKGETTITAGRVGGWQTFGYVVRVRDPGNVYLGEVVLPTYDPDRKEYAVARVDLGNVQVRGGTVAPRPAGSVGADDDAKKERADPFASIGPAKLSLRPFDRAGDPGMAPRTFWSLVLVPPMLVLLGGGLGRGWRALRRRQALRRQDPATLASRALGDLSRAKGAKDQASAAERVVHLSIEAATGLKARGVLLTDLGQELENRGLERPLSEEVCAVLGLCSDVRFEPSPDRAAGEQISGRARQLVARISKARAARPAPTAAPPASVRGAQP